MPQPIKSKVNSLAAAPTPQNTPASLTSSYLKSNPLTSDLPKTINEDDENELLKQKLTSNPALLSMLQGRLGSLVGAKSGYVDSLPKKVKNRIYSLKAVQSELQTIEAEFQKELFELEKKYLGKYAPVHEKRKKIIVGELEPTEEEVAKGKEIEKELGADEDEEDEEDEEESEEEESEDAEVKGIPDFWLTALENLSQVANIITERDQEVLSYLTNIKLQYFDKPGFQLVFEFAPNPFFKNKELTKTYYYQEELGYSGDFIYDHAEGTTIDWVSTKQNVTISIERRKQRNKTTQQTRTVEKATPTDSFFNFFDPPRADENVEDREDINEEELDEVAEELEQRLAFDYQLGEEIKDKLIPRAIDWFTGSAIEYEGDEFDDEEFGDDDDEDEDEDDEEEDDDDDDDDDEKSEGTEKKQPPECKQS